MKDKEEERLEDEIGALGEPLKVMLNKIVQNTLLTIELTETSEQSINEVHELLSPFVGDDVSEQDFTHNIRRAFDAEKVSHDSTLNALEISTETVKLIDLYTSSIKAIDCSDNENRDRPSRRQLATDLTILRATAEERVNSFTSQVHELGTNVARLRYILGYQLVENGEWQKGLELLLENLQELQKVNRPEIQSTTLYKTGRAYEMLTDWPNARLYYRDALRLFQDLKDNLGVARSRSGLGSILVSQGFFDKGLSYLTAAREGFFQLDLAEEMEKVDKLIYAAQNAQKQQLAQGIPAGN